MKKLASIMALVCGLTLTLPTALAAETERQWGVFPHEVENYSLTLLDDAGEQASSYLGEVDGTTKTLYDGVEKLELAFSGSDDQYVVYLLSGTESTPTPENLRYIDQAPGAGDNTFTIYPADMEVAGDYTICLASTNTSIQPVGSFTVYADATVVEIGVSLDKTLITVDGGSENFTATAAATAADGSSATGVTWSVVEPDGVTDGGVSIATDGIITVDSKAQKGTYTIQAVGAENLFGAGVATATAQLEIDRTESEVARVTVSATDDGTSITVPADGVADAAATFTATAIDQFGDDMKIAAADFKWEMADYDDGDVDEAYISVDDGVVTVTNAAKALIPANATANQMKFFVGASYDETYDEVALTISRVTSEATSLVIYKDGVEVSEDTITVPAGETANTASYTAAVLDQYGEDMEKTIDWNFTTATDSVTYADKTVTVTKDADEDEFALTATYNTDELTASVDISVVDIAITWPTYTVKTAPTYGDTWTDILTQEVAGSATLDGAPVAGAFTIKAATATPAAGGQIYTVVFTSTEPAGYQVEKAYTEDAVTIAKKDITISGMTAEGKTYNGNTDATLVYTAVTFGGILDGDTLSVTADGAFESATVGESKTVTISNLVLGGTSVANYQLAASGQQTTTTATIAQKTLTAAMVSAIDSLSYTGDALEPAVTVTDGVALTLDSDYTVTYANNINAGTATVTITGMGCYEGEVEVNFAIDKAVYTGSTAAVGTARVGASGTVSLVAWSGIEGVAFGEPSITDGTVIITTSVNDGVLNFAIIVGAIPAAEEDVFIPVTSTNYQDFSVTVTVRAADLDVPALAVEDIEKTYDNLAITGEDIVGVATIGGRPIQGTWAIADDEIMDVDDSGVYAVTFTADDTTNYADATTYFSVTINPATLTFTPADLKAYKGEAMPPLTYTTDGLLDDSHLTIAPTLSCNADMSANGSYDIMATGAVATDNYEIVYEVGTLTVSTKSSGGSLGGGGGVGGDVGGAGGGVAAPSVELTTNDDGSVTATLKPAISTSKDVVSATVDKTKMTTTMDAAIKAAKDKAAHVAFAVNTKSSTETVAVTFTSDAMTTLADSDAKSLTITSGLGDVTLPADVVANLAAQADGDEIVVSIKAVDVAQDLNDKQAAAVGDAPVVDVVITCNGVQITSFGGGEIIVTLPYQLKDGESAEHIVAWYIDDVGDITPMETTYDEKAATVTFVTTHCSFYAVVCDTNPFEDVYPNDYYNRAVQWAVKQGITTGATETFFAPTEPCDRAQAVTFLWRAMGSPKATGENPFVDVDADIYYYDAVLWAVEQGITKGTSEDTFSPALTCTRNQIVTFLYRLAGEPEVTAENPFEDVSGDAFFYDAVLWAVEQDITKGTSDTTFDTDEICDRAQIVTFLYRHLAD